MTIKTSALPREIKASVGPKVLAKASELFDHGLRTILNELLQNSRRSGATIVAITAHAIDKDRVEITITDNGSGIEDPSKLLTFGDSGWDLATDYRESAAGMGFFSVASRGCVVQSLNWQTHLEPAVFVGRDKAVVRAVTLPIVGTCVTFIEKSDQSSAMYEIERAVQNYPVATTINGKPAKQVDFLECAVFIKEVLGVRLGVIEGEPTMRNDKINFHGLCVGIDALAVVEYPLSGRKFYAIADVVDAPQLRLVLPTRHAVIKDESYAQLRAAAYLAILEHCTSVSDILAFKDFKAAQNAGIALPEPVPALHSWKVYSRDDNPLSYDRVTSQELPEDRSTVATLDDRYKSGVDAVNLHYAYEALASESLVFFGAETKFEGYQWYNALPQVADITYEIRTDHNVMALHWEDSTFTSPFTADELHIVLALKREKKTLPPVRLAASALALTEDVYESCFVTSRELPPDTYDLLDLLMHAQFLLNDSGDTDSYDTQYEYAKQQLLPMIMELLLSTEDAVIESMRNAVRSIRFEMHRVVDSVTITNDTATVNFTNGEVRTLTR